MRPRNERIADAIARLDYWFERACKCRECWAVGFNQRVLDRRNKLVAEIGAL